MKHKIAIIGGGNLGRAMAEGLLKDGNQAPESISITRRNIGALQDLSEKGLQVTSDNVKAVSDSKLIILAIQPGHAPGVLHEIAPVLDPEHHIIISLVTGFSLTHIEAATGSPVPVYRAMPNTAIALCESMTCLATADNDPGRAAIVTDFFRKMGEAIIIDEEMMASATVLGACGIAYVMRFIRACSQGGIEIGFDAELAQLIATQTVKGAAALLQEGHNHPEREIDKVTTPRGCTIAGLNEMEHRGFSSALIKGITTSHRKIVGD